MKSFFLGFILTFIFHSFAGDDIFKSQVYDWNNATSIKTSSGLRRHFIKCSTNNLDCIDIAAITINPGRGSNGDHADPDMEKLVIVKDGKIRQSINGKAGILGAGSVILVCVGDQFHLENVGNTPATFYLIQWLAPINNTRVHSSAAKSEVIDWNDAEFIKTEKGGVRHFFKRSTPMLAEFEMHVTTLKEGVKSHDPHTHPDDEIILVKSGTVEELVNGRPFQLGAGSFVLLNGNEPHGIRNAGNVSCEYFAFRFLNHPQ